MESRKLRRIAAAVALLAIAGAVSAEPRTRGELLAQATPSPAPGAAPAGSGTPAAATAPAQGVLTLAQAYQLALENDANLRSRRAATDVRRERLPQARSQLLPNVSANGSRFRNDLETTQPGAGGRPVTSENQYTSSSRALVIRQPIFRPALMADYRQAKAQVAEAEAQLDTETQSLAVRVTTAYMQALLAQEQLTLIGQQRTTVTAQLEAARRALAAGSGTRTDIDEAQARLDLNVAQELEARQNVDFTRRQLQSIVAVPVTNIAPVDEQRLPLVAPVPASLDAWVARSEESSPELRAQRAQIEAIREEVRKARAGHLPTLDGIAQWSVSKSDNVTRIDTEYDNKQIGVQLNVPIFAGGLVNSQVRAALADQLRAEEALEALRRDLSLRVEREYRGVVEGILRIRALEQAVRSAETAVTSSQRSYQAGARTQIDVLNAQEQRSRALRDLAEARFNYMLSRIRLRSLAGDADTAALEEASSWLKP